MVTGEVGEAWAVGQVAGGVLIRGAAGEAADKGDS